MTEAQPSPSAADLRGLFPHDFVWGVATSAYQIEGAVLADGRAASIWDTFCREPGRVANGDNGDVACDHYHRWAEDIGLLADLGVAAYRFSVAWPRVMPSGTGRVNRRGLDFYDRLVDGLLEHGIAPTVNLYHWDLPQALQDRGGWANPSIVGWFGDYAAAVAGRLGDRVTSWMTLNEPQVFTFLGHATGEHAPGLRDWPTALIAAHHALAAHAAAARAIRASAQAPRIGIAIDVTHAVPATDRDEDRQATALWCAARHGWFLDPLFGRGYPSLALEAHAAAGHLERLVLGEVPNGELDYLGINYYFRQTISARPTEPLRPFIEPPARAELTEMGWHVDPGGLALVLRDLHERYAPADTVVTENGAAYPDRPPRRPAGQVDDADRRSYLARHVLALADARAAGVPVSGYHVWSLLDNFEWSSGYGRRFGIVHVDFASQRRQPKASFDWYRQLIRG
ncbi:MAG TPA: GH1 family beta-glucosidase [Candidatus Limnocylindrales bacterium]|jgi:beta-glucosidase|nr:GH1 family beta-glucosidase [Candidatus Limnocylindrales bacterium]